MLSPDGVSRMWDKDANGYARGDGVASLLLKPLCDAIADGDRIEAIIRETGVNQDGATAGLKMPSAIAQKALIHATYAKWHFSGLILVNLSSWLSTKKPYRRSSQTVNFSKACLLTNGTMRVSTGTNLDDHAE
jgi:3-oxoacyl-(acyl-carrier-protein) synthase